MAEESALFDFLKSFAVGDFPLPELSEQEKKERGFIRRNIPVVDYIGLALPEVLPKDRAAEGEVKGVTPVLPGAKNLKDIIGGVPGILKGIVVDNVTPIIGAKPLSSGDQPYTPLMMIEDAAFSVAKLDRKDRYHISEIDYWPADVRQAFLRELQSDFRLRAGVASTEAGRKLLAEREIQLTQNDRDIAAALQAKRELAAKKRGASNPIVKAAVNYAINDIVNAATQLDQLFAANPPDP